MTRLLILLILIFAFADCSSTFAQQEKPEVIKKTRGFLEPNNPLERTLQQLKTQEKQYHQEKMKVDPETYKILENLKNPFIPQLPKKKEKQLPAPKPQENKPAVKTIPKQPNQNDIPQIPKPTFSIAGLVWNTDRPQAIIDNQIYDIGDTIQSWVITEIQKEGIEVKFRDQTFFIEK